MFDRAQARMLPVVNRAIEQQAPTVGVCCNACRTCTTTNLLGLAAAFGAGAVAFVARSVRRIGRHS
jgi:hypothetical protein